MLVIVSARCTCMWCPTQWEGTLADGRTFYLRERHGHARLDVPYGTTVRAVDVPEGSLGELADFLRIFPEISLAPDAQIGPYSETLDALIAAEDAHDPPGSRDDFWSKVYERVTAATRRGW